MDIKITFVDGRWKTDPNPAIVLAGTNVRWIVQAPKSQLRNLRWTVGFGNGSPFSERSQFIIKTQNTGLGSRNERLPAALEHLLEDMGVAEDVIIDHRGVTEPVTAEDPGDYKYDLLVENADNGEPVGDEDPVLIVLHGSVRVWF